MTRTVGIVTPAGRGTRTGNRVTALSWARVLRGLGHRVFVEQEYSRRPRDVMVALHARRSAPAVQAFRADHPDAPVVLVMTGTDLYADLPDDEDARRSLELATRIVCLQEQAVEELPAAVRAKARVIHQSARAPKASAAPAAPGFPVCVVGHLRPVKDPFLAARALQHVPADSSIVVLQIGGAMSIDMAEEAEHHAREDARYRWLGERRHGQTLRLLAGCRLLVLTSRLEGAGNVISEALAAGVPVLATRMGGAIGMLGDDYPGLFPIGDEKALAAMLVRAERDGAFMDELAGACRERTPLVAPEREREAWRALMAEL